MGIANYVRTLLRDPHVASIAPSSRYAIATTCRNADFSRANVVVEFGPGGGCFTEYVLRRMPKNGVFLAFETNRDFASRLRSEISDPRLVVIERSAEFIAEELAQRGLPLADFVISGIPFSMLPLDVKDRILRATAESLTPTGRFLTYQFVPPLASFDSFLRRPMERYFELTRIEYELRNLPPLRIYESRSRIAEANSGLLSRRLS